MPVRTEVSCVSLAVHDPQQEGEDSHQRPSVKVNVQVTQLGPACFWVFVTDAPAAEERRLSSLGGLGLTVTTPSAPFFAQTQLLEGASPDASGQSLQSTFARGLGMRLVKHFSKAERGSRSLMVSCACGVEKEAHQLLGGVTSQGLSSAAAGFSALVFKEVIALMERMLVEDSCAEVWTP